MKQIFLIIIISFPFLLGNTSLSPASSFTQETNGFLNEWALERLHIPDAWDYSKGVNTVIALIDAGIATTYFEQSLWTNVNEIPNNSIDDDNNGYIDDIHGWNFLDNTSDISDHSPRSHGTSVSSILRETAPESKIMMIKILDDQDRFYSSQYPELLNALEYVMSFKVDVLYLPLHLPNIPSYVVDMFSDLVTTNTTIIAAAGQDDSGAIGTLFDPANLEMVIAVGGFEASEAVYRYGTFGTNMEIVAPANNLNALTKNNITTTVEGTSFAGAFLSGIVSLAKSYNQEASSSFIRTTLQKTAQDINVSGKDIYSGYGVAQAHHFVRTIKDSEPPLLLDYNLSVINPDNSEILLSFTLEEESGIAFCEFFYEYSGTWITENPCTSEDLPIYSNKNKSVTLKIFITISTSILKFSINLRDINDAELLIPETLILTGLPDLTNPISSSDQSIIPTEKTSSSDFSDTNGYNFTISTGSGRPYDTDNNSKIRSSSISWVLIIQSLLIFFVSSYIIKKYRKNHQ